LYKRTIIRLLSISFELVTNLQVHVLSRSIFGEGGTHYQKRLRDSDDDDDDDDTDPGPSRKVTKVSSALVMVCPLIMTFIVWHKYSNLFFIIILVSYFGNFILVSYFAEENLGKVWFRNLITFFI